MKTCILFAMTISSIAFASGVSAQPTDPVAMKYSEEHRVSIEEATRRLGYIDKAADLQAKLEKDEPIRFGGLYIDNGQNFRVVVMLVGGADNLLRRYTQDPVFVAEKAANPLHTLKNKQQALLNALKGNEPEFAIDLDVRSNKLTIIVPDITRARSRIKAKGLVDSDVSYIEAKEFAVPIATILGGRPIDGPTLSDSSYEIGTTGFNVVNGAGIRGVLTAGHFGECLNTTAPCTMNAPAKVNGVTMTHMGQLNSGSDDFEWRSASGHSFPNQINYGSAMTITATRDPTTFPVGTTVCKYGRTTGYACGTIESTAATSTYNGVVGTYVRVKPVSSASLAELGDSGGPVFGANTAYGIIHAKLVTSGYAGQMIFMPITRISGLGLAVVTTP